LKDVDGVVFVCDSQSIRHEANIDAYLNLQENLQDYKIDLKAFPHVIQYNKRDLDDLTPIEEMREEINTFGVPDFPASAAKGEGVLETLRAIVKLTTERVKKELQR
jgi:GTPase involved in cell partitioning and DNA repair